MALRLSEPANDHIHHYFNGNRPNGPSAEQQGPNIRPHARLTEANGTADMIEAKARPGVPSAPTKNYDTAAPKKAVEPDRATMNDDNRQARANCYFHRNNTAAAL
jgi:hypothetical protein